MRKRKLAKWGNLMQRDPAKQPTLIYTKETELGVLPKPETIALLDPNRQVVSILRSDFEANARAEAEPRIVEELVIKASPQVTRLLAGLRKKLMKMQALLGDRKLAQETFMKLFSEQVASLRVICEMQEKKIALLLFADTEHCKRWQLKEQEKNILRAACTDYRSEIAKLKSELASAYLILEHMPAGKGPLGVKNGKDLTELYCRAYKRIMAGVKRIKGER